MQFIISMGKKTQCFRRTSRSNEWVQKLFYDAIREVKEQNINTDDLTCKESEDEVKVRDLLQQKTRKRPIRILQEFLKKQEQSRKQRTALVVPVSQLAPFKTEDRGFLFPRDYRRESASLSWIPLSEEPGKITEYNARRSLCSDFNGDWGNNEDCTGNSKESKSFSVRDILQILPLRAGTKDGNPLSGTSNRDSQPPPIYKQDLWRETMRKASVHSCSIPAKHDAWSIRDPTSLMVGKQELYRREKCKSTMSLAERRIRLRAASMTRNLP